MFDAYNVEFNEDLLTRIKEYTLFKYDSLPETSEIQGLLAESDSQLLSLKKKTTLHELQALLLDVCQVLLPVEGYLPIFDHFHLQSSQLFIAYMNEHMPQSGTASATIETLKRALISARSDFETFLKGTATRQSVLFQSVANVDSIEEEIGKLVLYKEFSMYNSSKVLENIENALIIPEVIEGAKSLLVFCKEFELEKSVQSEPFQLLQEVCEKMDKAAIQNMTLEKATNTIEAIKRILKSSGEVNRLLVLKNLSSKLIRVKKFFSGTAEKGRHQFQQKYELVTEQLQRSAKGLEKLHNILGLLSPLNSPTTLALFDVLAIFSRLDEVNIRGQFTTVVNDIELIKTWLSVAEVCMRL